MAKLKHKPPEKKSKPAKKEGRKSNAGRKWFDGKDKDVVLSKLETAFALDYTDVQAAFYAGIGERALWRYCKAHPEFRQRKEALKDTGLMQAKIGLMELLKKKDKGTVLWLLERAEHGRFGLKKLLGEDPKNRFTSFGDLMRAISLDDDDKPADDEQ